MTPSRPRSFIAITDLIWHISRSPLTLLSMSGFEDSTKARLARWYRSPLGYGLTGGFFYWASLPWALFPLLSKTLWPLGWIAPVWWVVLVRRDTLMLSDPPDESTGRVRRFFRRPYVQLWLAGFIFWLATIHWLRLPHPATYLGWISLCFYLGFYLPIFVGVSRVAVHRMHVPVFIAAPIVWTGLEYVRAYMITGFLMAALGHTQYQWITLIQISDIFGAYAVCFLMMFVAACLARMLHLGGESKSSSRLTWWPVVPAAVAVAATLVYGHWRMSDVELAPGPTIALIQGSIDTEIKADPTATSRIYGEYIQLSRDAMRAAPDTDLVVWPETMYRMRTNDGFPLLWLEPGLEITKPEVEKIRQESLADMKETAEDVGAPLLLGINTAVIAADGQRRHNSAVFVDRDGQAVARYDKMHRVLFGEYIPFAEQVPWLARLTPLPSTVAAGRQSVAFEIEGVNIAPNICYETVLPQVIRRQVFDLHHRQYMQPDVLVNLTNDGWFWGSSQLDQHLICDVFRAIEMRKPLLIAANTGFSAWIDSDGRIVEQGPRRETGIIIAKPEIDSRNSLYMELGDWFPGLCLLLTTIAALFGAVNSWRRKRTGAAEREGKVGIGGA